MKKKKKESETERPTNVRSENINVIEIYTI